MKTVKPINTKEQRAKLIKELLKVVEVVEFDPKTTTNLKGAK
jgi:glycerol-3-phosphate cytidylyltransferase-like family protein